MRNNNIPIHKKKDFEGMREAGSLAADVLDSLNEKIVPGISTQEINDICHDQIIQNKAIPAPLNYKVSQNQFVLLLIMLFVMVSHQTEFLKKEMLST